MHRSGTSAVARLLNLMGAYFGAEGTSTGASEENKKGFWERRDVRALNDSILHNAHCDWDRVAEFDIGVIPSDLLNTYRRRAGDIVLNMDAHRPWFIKEPRLCMLFDVWRPVLEMPYCVHVLRNPIEVAQSLKRRNGIPVNAGLALWEIYNTRAIESSFELPHHFVSYNELMRAPDRVAESIGNALTSHSEYTFRVPSSSELEAAISQDLYRERTADSDIAAKATMSQNALHATLLQAVKSQRIDRIKTSRTVIRTLRRFESSGEHLAARIRRSNAQELSKLGDDDPRLSLKSFELERALALAQQQRAAMESKDELIAKMRSTEQDRKTQLALKDQLIRRLEGTARSVELVTKERHSLELRLAVMEQVVDRLKVDLSSKHEDLKAKDQEVKAKDQEVKAKDQEVKAKDQEAKAKDQELKRLQSNAKSAVKKLTDESLRISKRNQVLVRDSRRSRTELHLKAAQLADLSAGIQDVLSSRRWRLGHFLLSLRYRLLLRKVPPMAIDLINEILRQLDQSESTPRDAPP